MLDLRVRLRLGEMALSAALSVRQGQVLVLVGESGSGKTTLLKLIAGLLAPDAGSITLAGRTLVDRDAGVWVPAHERRVGYVAQDYALFPHLSVSENVAFGLRASGLRGAAVRERAGRGLDALGVASLASRRPHQLSGGQQQRVALARALVLDPEVLLLDEPLSALDLKTKRSVRAELRRTLEGLSCATIFVTHHPAEALAFGDVIAVLESGLITQCGSREEFLRHPRSSYVAEFLGVNLVSGRIISRAADGLAVVAVEDQEWFVVDRGENIAVRLLLHPREIVLSRELPEGSARNVIAGVVEEVIPEPPEGDQVRVLLATRPALAAQITRHSAEQLALRPGLPVYASFKASGVTVLPA